MSSISITRRPDGQPVLYHGGDYNPDQWLHMPEIIDEDLRLMKLARVNTVSIGIFAWVSLEPEEGRFTFEWMDEIIDRLHAQDITVFLATPTGARPAWLSEKYPEVLRVDERRERQLHGRRHNHCYTSPAYRERTTIIATEIARRYASHPAVGLWHLSNEYGGECHCPLCQDAFRTWLRARYEDDLDRLNRAWWTSFWSHTYTSWDQVESPSSIGESAVHGHTLDWKRFVTHQTRDFMRHEISALRAVSSDIPVTTNLMGFYPVLDYFKLAEDLDVVSWDSYPSWHGSGAPVLHQWNEDGDDSRLASDVAMSHDLNRSLVPGKPFLLMESTPSMTNWQHVSKQKRPGMHLLSSLLAIAHGSDSVQYFQWRKSRGSSEKFHGAVVDHVGHEHTRTFRDVQDVGEALETLRPVAGAASPADVAILYDWENRWDIDDAFGPRRERRNYLETALDHYYELRRRSVCVDIVDEDRPLDGYKLLVAPMLSMVRPGVADRIIQFVNDGGIFVTTYWTGLVDESDLAFLGGFPGPLRELLGIWAEETDALYPDDALAIELDADFGPAAAGHHFAAEEYADLIHLEGAEQLAHYANEFYAGRPSLTRKRTGAGAAYYIASRNEQSFLSAFYEQLVGEIAPRRAIERPLPEGVFATTRDSGDERFRFFLNFGTEWAMIPAPGPGEEILYRSPEPYNGDPPTLPGRRDGASYQPDPTALAPYGVQVRRSATS